MRLPPESPPTGAARHDPPVSELPGDGRASSARSLLVTTLGEFVHTGGGTVWTGTLVDALGALGVEEKSARQALSRSAADGLLEPGRHGRRVQWSLTAKGAALLSEGTGRIYGFLRSTRQWDGRWLIVSVGVPESQRRARHRLRTRLSWLGMGSPSPGLWVVPDAGKEAEVHAVIAELGLDGRAFAWAGPAVGDVDMARLIESAWDLREVAERYRAFVERFRDEEVRTPREAFVAQVELVHEWRRFPFIDPDLPAELLDRAWPGTSAAALFHDRHARWDRRAREEWARMEQEWGSRV